MKLIKFIKENKVFVSIIFSVLSLVMSAGYIVYKLANERAYREKWKDYNDCGLS
ncbi:hypothetical protein [Candidatus Soleaferrea massiliensis]|uniref:hypothetical protein n=1 Tax=Candidatus Soleaferrea massiliensis TaxID=1470354 RepID=UPI0012E0AF6F|nr:hypothetical protein [Candidatus Soleaferrea massiliensis]